MSAGAIPLNNAEAGGRKEVDKMANSTEIAVQASVEKERWKLLALTLQIQKAGGSIEDVIEKLQSMTEAD